MTKWGTYHAKTYKTWLTSSAEVVEQYSGEAIATPVRCDVLFAIPRARTSKLIVPKGDGDNYEKATYDMLQNRGYLADDKWITTAEWRKRFVPTESQGYTRIIITDETEEIDLND